MPIPCGAVAIALNDRLIYLLATGSFERPNLPRSCKSTRNSPRRTRTCREQAARTFENEDKYHLNPLVVKLGCLEPGDPSGGACSHTSAHVFSMRSHIFLFFRVEGRDFAVFRSHL